jgi:hypothetical protein
MHTIPNMLRRSHRSCGSIHMNSYQEAYRKVNKRISIPLSHTKLVVLNLKVTAIFFSVHAIESKL